VVVPRIKNELNIINEAAETMDERAHEFLDASERIEPRCKVGRGR
jgi:hypothetical protein